MPRRMDLARQGFLERSRRGWGARAPGPLHSTPRRMAVQLRTQVYLSQPSKCAARSDARRLGLRARRPRSPNKRNEAIHVYDARGHNLKLTPRCADQLKTCWNRAWHLVVLLLKSAAATHNIYL